MTIITTQNSAFFDWDLCLQQSEHDDALAQELLAMFVAELPEQQLQIRDAYHKQDMQTVKDVVHKLHGSTCYIAVPQLKKATQAFEQAILDQDQAAWPDCFTILDKTIDKTLQAIKNA